MIFDVLIRIKEKTARPLAKVRARMKGIFALQDKINRRVIRPRVSTAAIDGLFGKLKGLKSFLIGAFAFTSVVAFGKDVLQTTAQVQGLNNAIEFASGSAQEARLNFEFLDDITNRLGLDSIATKQGFQTLSGAMIGTGVSAAQTRQVFSNVSTAVSAMNLNAEAAQGVFIALGQIMSKGTVQAEELRGQLGERIPGAFSIAAKSLGVTTAQLNDMLKKGEVLSKDFLPKFAAELQRTFEGALPQAVNSLQANMNRFNNTVTELKVNLGTSLIPVITPLLQQLGKAVGFFSEVVDFVRENIATIRTVIRPVTEAVRPLVEAFQGLFEKLGLMTDRTTLLQNVFNLLGNWFQFVGPIIENHFGLIAKVVDVIGDWIKAIMDIVQSNNIFIKVVAAFGKAVIGIFQTIGKAAIDLLGGVGDLVTGIFTFDFTKIKSSIIQLGSAVKGVAVDTGVNAAKGFVDGLKNGFKFTDFFAEKRGQESILQKAAGVSRKTTDKGGVTSGQAEVNKVVGDTRRQRNITVNIGKLVENITFNHQTLKESAADLEKEMVEIFMRAIRDAETAL